jgi:16S rRNA (cytosine967-C5)-methyltransferase
MVPLRGFDWQAARAACSHRFAADKGEVAPQITDCAHPDYLSLTPARRDTDGSSPR